VAALRDRRQVLVLDNFERVLAAAGVVEVLLQGCPEIVVVVTSRAPLHLAAERELTVGALDRETSATLFLDRARTARAGFIPSDATAIASICERLDRIPLAIELAAARIKVLSPSQVAERLRDRFRLLTAGDVDAPPRHCTLRAALDWSFELLPEPERALLRRMGVFAAAPVSKLSSRCAPAACWSPRTCSTAWRSWSISPWSA
jgi:predicted ATPase